MTYYESQKLRSGFYERKSKRNLSEAVIISGVSVLFAVAFFYGLRDSLNRSTQLDCQAGIQRACEALK